jgi:hypothetical protein
MDAALEGSNTFGMFITNQTMPVYGRVSGERYCLINPPAQCLVDNHPNKRGVVERPPASAGVFVSGGIPSQRGSSK